MTIAEESALEGSEGLNQKNKRIYESLKTMVNLKYLHRF